MAERLTPSAAAPKTRYSMRPDEALAAARQRLQLPVYLLAASLGLTLLSQVIYFFTYVLIIIRLISDLTDQAPVIAILMLPLLYLAVTMGLMVLTGMCLFEILKIVKLQNRDSALVWTAIAALPVLGPMCVFNLPLGIWLLVLLHDESIRRVFRSR